MPEDDLTTGRNRNYIVVCVLYSAWYGIFLNFPYLNSVAVGHDAVEGDGVTPQISAGESRSITTLNYIVAHSLQQNSNNENLNRMP